MKLKFGACLGAVAMTGSLLLSMSPAYADGENANATAIQSTLLDVPVTHAQANCPGPDSHNQSTVPLVIGSIQIGVANAQCTDSSAKSSVASVKVRDSSDPFNTVFLSAIKSSCRNDGTFTSTVTVGTGNIGIFAGPITTPTVINLGGAAIYLNEHTTDGGFNGVNAVRIQLGGPEQGQNLILAQSRCNSDNGFGGTNQTHSTNNGGLLGLGLNLLGIHL